MSRLHDWRWDAEQYRDIDREAQRKAEAAIALEKVKQDKYLAAITGTDPKATAKLNKALRHAWKLDKSL